MRIQKYLASKSHYSRRAIEQLIEEKKIKVNGTYIQAGQSVKHGDRIQLERRKITVNLEEVQQDKVLMVNKPLGVICSKKDEKDRPSVYSLLPKKSEEKWVMVGRLDINSSGLILFCNNGDMANQLMHPRHELVRTYRVRVYGKACESHAEKLEEGVICDGVKLQCVSCRALHNQRDGMNQWYEMELKTGHNRMIRKMWDALGMQVSRLVRTGYGGIFLPQNIGLGKSRMLTEKELEVLKKNSKSP